MLFKEFVGFHTGINNTRLTKEEKTIEIYNIVDLNFDKTIYTESFGELPFRDKKYLTSRGDLIYNCSIATAAVVSEKNTGKRMSQNFVVLTFDRERYDKYFVCYLLNNSRMVKSQLSTLKQGSSLLRTMPASIKEISVDVPNLEQQRKIGKMYIKTEQMIALKKKAIKLEEELLYEAIEKVKNEF